MPITYKFLFYAFLVENVVCFVKKKNIWKLGKPIDSNTNSPPSLLPDIKFQFSQECWEAEKKELRKPKAKAIRAFMC